MNIHDHMHINTHFTHTQLHLSIHIHIHMIEGVIFFTLNCNKIASNLFVSALMTYGDLLFLSIIPSFLYVLFFHSFFFSLLEHTLVRLCMPLRVYAHVRVCLCLLPHFLWLSHIIYICKHILLYMSMYIRHLPLFGPQITLERLKVYRR